MVMYLFEGFQLIRIIMMFLRMLLYNILNISYFMILHMLILESYVASLLCNHLHSLLIVRWQLPYAKLSFIDFR